MNASSTLTRTEAPDYAGTRLSRWTLAFNGESAFQDVDQWGLPYDGSPRSSLYDDLCDLMVFLGRLDADALNAL